MQSKVQTYVGFSVKAGKFVQGTDRIEGLKKSPCLILTDGTLASNGMEKIVKAGDRLGCPVLFSPIPLETLSHRRGCKALALTDKNLSDGILREAEKEGFEFLRKDGGNE